MNPKPPPSRPGSLPTPRRLLIVEDSPTDRELIRYLLEARFKEAVVYEAATLHAAVIILGHEGADCVILDLQLPDSTGTSTFRELNDRFPDIPIIVMTHNKDRSLAIRMIHLGAADYMIKNFTDEEELCRRILFAIEKHKVSVRVDPDDAASVHRLDRAQANLKTAHQSGQHSAIRDTTVEVTSAMADLSRQMFAEMAKISNQMAQVDTNQSNVAKTVENLDREILRGTDGRKSMRSQVDLMDHRLNELEGDVSGMKEAAKAEGQSKQQGVVQLEQSRMSNRTLIILGVVSLIGAIVTAIVSYEAATHSSSNSATVPVSTVPAPAPSGGKK